MSSLILLHDLISSTRFPKTLPHRWNFSNLGSILFPIDHSPAHLPFKYISKTMPVKRDEMGAELGYKNGELYVGDYENQLLGALLTVKEPVICIIGAMGSGKTTTVKYLLDILENGACSICGRPKCCHKKYVLINFNRDLFPKQESKTELKLASRVAQKLSAALNDTELMTIDIELTEFWPQMLVQLEKTYYSSVVFSEINIRLNAKSIDLGKPLTDDALENLKQIRNSVIEEPLYAIEYFYKLWGFVSRTYFKEERSNFLLIFDNFDGSAPAVQTAILRLLTKYACEEFRTVVPIRPETLECWAHNGTRGSVAFWTERQEGPLPYDVIYHHIQSFLNNPNYYTSKAIGLHNDSSEFLSKYWTTLIELSSDTQSNQYHVLENFFHDTCGRNIRTGLLSVNWV